MSNSTHDRLQGASTQVAKQMFWLTMGVALVVFIIFGLIYYVTSNRSRAPTAIEWERGVAERLQKIGSVEVRQADRPLATGEEVFKAQCSACHATGVSGAPKFGNASDWAPRIGKGFDALLHSALNGRGNMAPQGGGNFSDLEVSRAVVYMANAGGAKFEEPAAPASEAAAQ